MRKIIFQPPAFKQYKSWEKNDKEIFSKITELLDEVRIKPFAGLGKPEPLKYELKGHWSRRINHEHRLVYRVTTDAIVVVACKYHY